jgi:acetylornithine/succinyldiaminopimelate/putrescine aminotransferase
MRRIDAPRLAVERGAQLRAGLERLAGVAAVRGEGLLLAAELADGRDAKQAYTDLLAAGLVTNAVTSTALRFAPPLTVSPAEVDEALGILATVVG